MCIRDSAYAAHSRSTTETDIWKKFFVKETNLLYESSSWYFIRFSIQTTQNTYTLYIFLVTVSIKAAFSCNFDASVSLFMFIPAQFSSLFSVSFKVKIKESEKNREDLPL